MNIIIPQNDFLGYIFNMTFLTPELYLSNHHLKLKDELDQEIAF